VRAEHSQWWLTPIDSSISSLPPYKNWPTPPTEYYWEYDPLQNMEEITLEKWASYVELRLSRLYQDNQAETDLRGSVMLAINTINGAASQLQCMANDIIELCDELTSDQGKKLTEKAMKVRKAMAALKEMTVGENKDDGSG
jgi:hypothetical protein